MLNLTFMCIPPVPGFDSSLVRVWTQGDVCNSAALMQHATLVVLLQDCASGSCINRRHVERTSRPAAGQLSETAPAGLVDAVL